MQSPGSSSFPTTSTLLDDDLPNDPPVLGVGRGVAVGLADRCVLQLLLLLSHGHELLLRRRQLRSLALLADTDAEAAGVGVGQATDVAEGWVICLPGRLAAGPWRLLHVLHAAHVLVRVGVVRVVLAPAEQAGVRSGLCLLLHGQRVVGHIAVVVVMLMVEAVLLLLLLHDVRGDVGVLDVP